MRRTSVRSQESIPSFRKGTRDRLAHARGFMPRHAQGGGGAMDREGRGGCSAAADNAPVVCRRQALDFSASRASLPTSTLGRRPRLRAGEGRHRQHALRRTPAAMAIPAGRPCRIGSAARLACGVQRARCAARSIVRSKIAGSGGRWVTATMVIARVRLFRLARMRASVR